MCSVAVAQNGPKQLELDRTTLQVALQGKVLWVVLGVDANGPVEDIKPGRHVIVAAHCHHNRLHRGGDVGGVEVGERLLQVQQLGHDLLDKTNASEQDLLLFFSLASPQQKSCL